MKSLKILIGGVCACLISSAQVPEIRPQVAGRAVQEGQVTIVHLAPRFATAIRMVRIYLTDHDFRRILGS